MPGRTTEADIEEAIREAEEELSPCGHCLLFGFVPVSLSIVQNLPGIHIYHHKPPFIRL